MAGAEAVTVAVAVAVWIVHIMQVLYCFVGTNLVFAIRDPVGIVEMDFGLRIR